MKELLKILFETIIIGTGGATLKIIFASDDVPFDRQVKIFLGSVVLATIVGYGLSFTELSKVWFIASVAASALLAETVIKIIMKKTPLILGKAIDKKFDIDENEK